MIMLVKRNDLRKVNFNRQMVAYYENGMFQVEPVDAFEKKFYIRKPDEFDKIVNGVLIIDEGGIMVDYPTIQVAYKDIRKLDTTKYRFVGYSKDITGTKGSAVFTRR